MLLNSAWPAVNSSDRKKALIKGLETHPSRNLLLDFKSGSEFTLRLPAPPFRERIAMVFVAPAHSATYYVITSYIAGVKAR